MKPMGPHRVHRDPDVEIKESNQGWDSFELSSLLYIFVSVCVGLPSDPSEGKLWLRYRWCVNAESRCQAPVLVGDLPRCELQYMRDLGKAMYGVGPFLLLPPCAGI